MSDAAAMHGLSRKGPKKALIILSCLVAFLSVLVIILSFFVVYLVGENDKSERKELIQHMVDTIEFDAVPLEKKPALKNAVTALLNACPRIADIATHGEKFSIFYHPDNAPNGWLGTDVHFEATFNLKPDSEDDLPPNLANGVYPTFGLMGGDKPGTMMLGSLPLWFCHVKGTMSDEEIAQAHDKKGVPFGQMMHFLPLRDIPPESF